MDKVDFMIIMSILKFGLAFVGIIVTLVMIVKGLVKKDQTKFKKAGLVFLGTCGILILLSAIEFAFLI